MKLLFKIFRKFRSKDLRNYLFFKRSFVFIGEPRGKDITFFANGEYYSKKKKFYLKDKNEEFALYMDPEQYIKENPSFKNLNHICLFLLQDKMHFILEGFLNGSFLTRKSMLFGPFIDEIDINNLNFREILFLAEFINKKSSGHFNDFIVFLKKYVDIKKISAKDLSKIISCFYSNFEEAAKQFCRPLSKVEIRGIRGFNEKEYIQKDKDFLRPLIKLSDFSKRTLQKYLKCFCVHGSMSTRDYIKGCSDLDTFAIIKKDTIKDFRKILRLRRLTARVYGFFYLTDPLQHHGIYFITEQDMLAYPESYFPLLLFDYSKAIFQSPNNLVFYVRDSSLERKRAFWDLVYYFRSSYLFNVFPKNLFKLKWFLQLLLLIPTLYLQLDGSYNYKKFTFAKIKRVLDERYVGIINKASLIRKENIYEFNSYFSRVLAKIITRIPLQFFISLYKFSIRVKPNPKLMEMVKLGLLHDAFIFSEKLLDLASRDLENI